jgi:rod shape-determining protein MreD
MSRALWFGLLLLTALVQVTWAPHLSLFGAFPNLVLLLVVVATWLAGTRAGMWWAISGGLLLDLTAAGPLGPHALALLAGSYVAGFWVRSVDATSVLQPVLATAVTTVIYSLVLIGSDDTLGLPVPPFGLAAGLTAAATAYNAALMLPLAGAVRRMRAISAAPA